MHILFLCDETTKYSDANLVICTRLAQKLRSRGHRVSMLGNCEAPTAPRREEIEGITNYRFYYPINRITHQILDDYNRDHSLVHLVLSLLRHPVTACVDILRAFTGFNPIEYRYVSQMKRIHAETPVDMAIASSGSFYTIHALAQCPVRCLRVGYMLDPYWKNHTVGGPRAKREELFAWKRLDHMVIPKLLEPDYADPDFAAYRGKGTAAEFPGIVQTPSDDTEHFFENGKVNLLFAGNFYEKIRSPEYLLQLMDEVPDNVCLNIMGGIFGSFGSEVTAHMQRLSGMGKLKLHGSLPAEQAHAAMKQADILVNIGNTVDNQLPSKIFEYFSTGKPVVHIQKLRDCPCLPYLARYGNALVLDEADAVTVNAEKVAALCASEWKSLPFEVVEDRFQECTISHVADQFLEIAEGKF